NYLRGLGIFLGGGLIERSAVGSSSFSFSIGPIGQIRTIGPIPLRAGIGLRRRERVGARTRPPATRLPPSSSAFILHPSSFRPVSPLHSPSYLYLYLYLYLWAFTGPWKGLRD